MEEHEDPLTIEFTVFVRLPPAQSFQVPKKSRNVSAIAATPTELPPPSPSTVTYSISE